MLLKISSDCEICGGKYEWIYSTEEDKVHRGGKGCPGGCTGFKSLRVTQISESEAQETVSEKHHPEENLDKFNS